MSRMLLKMSARDAAAMVRLFPDGRMLEQRDIEAIELPNLSLEMKKARLHLSLVRHGERIFANEAANIVAKYQSTEGAQRRDRLL